jgi:hypothetical protein
MIFLFFMITDPKTAPAGRVGRVVFGLLVAIASTVLMAPQTNEFGTKVGLLAGLVAVCAVRPLLDRLLPEPRSAADNLRGYATRLVIGDNAKPRAFRGAVRVALTIAAIFVLGIGIVAAGTPARGFVVPDTSEMLDGVPHQIDPATLPTITADVEAWDETIAGPIAQDLLVTLADNLELENQALLREDGSLLTAVDHGDRLREMQGRLHDAQVSGQTVITHYRFDAVHVVLIAPFGVQTGGSIGLESRGTVTEETYDARGTLLDRQTSPYALTFAIRRPTGDRWLIVAVLPPDKGS